jgi:hypothetical protein
MKQTHSVHPHLQHDQAVKLSLAGGKLLQIEHSHHWAAQPQTGIENQNSTGFENREKLLDKTVKLTNKLICYNN